MKVLTIIFCILTIIMLIALSTSIIKSEDKTSSNKEKRYTLIYIFSFIILMLSSIFSTLEINVISIILFILFLVLLIIATLIYFNNKKILNSKKKTLVPTRLKKILKVLKEERDGYTYKVKATLNCCDSNNFKITQIKSKDTNIIHCTCNKCNTEYELYNSELDGYNLDRDNNVIIIKEEFKDHKCKCNSNSYNVEINYEYLDDFEDIKKLGISDVSNLYTSIKVDLKCNECNKKEKDYIKNEFK